MQVLWLHFIQIILCSDVRFALLPFARIPRKKPQKKVEGRNSYSKHFTNIINHECLLSIRAEKFSFFEREENFSNVNFPSTRKNEHEKTFVPFMQPRNKSHFSSAPIFVSWYVCGERKIVKIYILLRKICAATKFVIIQVSFIEHENSSRVCICKPRLEKAMKAKMLS